MEEKLRLPLFIAAMPAIGAAVGITIAFTAPTGLASLLLVGQTVICASAAAVGSISKRPAVRSFSLAAIVPLAVPLIFVAQRLHGFLMLFGDGGTAPDDAIYWRDPVLVMAGTPMIFGAVILAATILGYLGSCIRRLID